YEDQRNGLYHCSYDGTKHYFYIKATVCENCYDLDKTLATGVMIGDVIFTLGVVLIVYLCAQNKAGKAAPQRAKQARSQGKGPAVPEPDYQPLNPGTRSNDVYASANHAV
ncbi:T-cell surface glycoprotein CD3 epsilon chain-like, partial [Trichomycterus rosablanca]|uniref:T-cell surface glycoprotein CD3 epsilon chain-like n=1 Tax=Trichomycterus rosablanca TaxID=2290929 RepID=UPI002F357E5B